MSAPDRRGDDAVLKALRERGDRAAIARPVFIWIYGSEADLQIVASRLSSSWRDTEPEPEESGWAIVAWRAQPADEESVFALSNEIRLAIEGTDARFDGWETSVERGH